MSPKYRKSILICNGSSCHQASKVDLIEHFNLKLKEYNLQDVKMELQIINYIMKQEKKILFVLQPNQV